MNDNRTGRNIEPPAYSGLGRWLGSVALERCGVWVCLSLLVVLTAAVPSGHAAPAAEREVRAQGAIASEPSGALRWQGQQLTFDITALGGTVARCALSVGYEGVDANLGSVLPMRGFCVTLGLMAAFLNFNYEGLVFADPETLEPIWGEKLLEDRGRSRTYETYYDQANFVAVVERREPARNSQRQYRRWIPVRTFDILTWIQDVRRRDFSVGNRYVYYVFDGWKLRRLTMTVTRHVDFTTSDGKSVRRAAEFDVDAVVLDSYPAAPWIGWERRIPPVYVPQAGDEMRIGEAWFSLDEQRLPLGLNIGTPFGKMRLRIREPAE